MNTKEIQEITIWSAEGQMPANKLKFISFYGYEFNDGAGYIDYQLLNANDEIVYNATLIIPENIVQQWGNDDEVIWNYVLQTLGLIKL